MIVWSTFVAFNLAMVNPSVAIYGERHGGRESVEYFVNLVREAIQNNDVVVALEVRHESQLFLDTYFDNPSFANQIALIDSLMWCELSNSDGKSTDAYLSMIDEFADIRRGSDNTLTVKLILPYLGYPDGGGIEENTNYVVSFMTEQIHMIRSDFPDHAIFALIGQRHAESVPTTIHLGDDVLSLDTVPHQLLTRYDIEVDNAYLANSGGEHYTCTINGCGVMPLRSSGLPGSERFDTVVRIGASTAARPVHEIDRYCQRK